MWGDHEALWACDLTCTVPLEDLWLYEPPCPRACVETGLHATSAANRKYRYFIPVLARQWRFLFG